MLLFAEADNLKIPFRNFFACDVYFGLIKRVLYCSSQNHFPYNLYIVFYVDNKTLILSQFLQLPFLLI